MTDTAKRTSNTVHVTDKDGNDYIGIMQKYGDFYAHPFEDGCRVYNPETGETKFVLDEDMHMEFLCSQFHAEAA